MSREEFLRGLEEALAGEVPASVVRDNLNYYSSYLSQELAKGRTMEEIIEEIGEPRIVARTIIDSTDAAAEAGDYGAYEDRSSRDGYGNSGYGSYDGGRRDMGAAMTAVPVRTAATAPTRRIQENGGSSPIISTISI